MFIKKETKQKLKNAWIEASPYVVPLCAALGLIAVSYDKYDSKRTDEYAKLVQQRAEDSKRATDAYLVALEEEAKYCIVKKNY